MKSAKEEVGSEKLKVESKMYKRIKSEKMKSKLVLQIHDELLFEASKDELDDLQAMVIEEMEGALKLDVPVIVESGVGDSWFEAH